MSSEPSTYNRARRLSGDTLTSDATGTDREESLPTTPRTIIDAQTFTLEPVQSLLEATERYMRANSRISIQNLAEAVSVLRPTDARPSNTINQWARVAQEFGSTFRDEFPELSDALKGVAKGLMSLEQANGGTSHVSSAQRSMSQATELLPVLKVKRAQARTARMEAELERKKKHLQAMQEQLEWQERLQAAENDADRRTADAKVAIQIIEKQEREVIKELKRGSTAQSEVVESSKRRKTGRQDSEDSPTIRIEDGADWEEEKSPMQNRDHVYGGIVRLDGDIQTLSAEVEKLKDLFEQEYEVEQAERLTSRACQKQIEEDRAKIQQLEERLSKAEQRANRANQDTLEAKKLASEALNKVRKLEEEMRLARTRAQETSDSVKRLQALVHGFLGDRWTVASSGQQEPGVSGEMPPAYSGR